MNKKKKELQTNKVLYINKFVLKNKPLIKKNIVGLKKTAGRNNSGKITS